MKPTRNDQTFANLFTQSDFLLPSQHISGQTEVFKEPKLSRFQRVNRQLDKLKNALMSVGSLECDKYCEELETYTRQIENRQVPVLPIKRSFYDENCHSPAKLQRLETGANNYIDADIDDVVTDDIAAISVNERSEVEVCSEDSPIVIIPQVRKVVNSRGRPKQLRTLNRNNAYHFR